MKNPSIPQLAAGIFMLVWATLFLTWTPLDEVRLISGIVLVPVGVLLIARYVAARRQAGRATTHAPPDAQK